MVKKGQKKKHKPNKPPVHGGGPSEERRNPELWKSLLTSVAALVLFFGLLEAFMAVLGVAPASVSEDPFVGFSSHSPLFVEETSPGGGTIMTTGGNKLIYFNKQSFPERKAPGTYRIFCLGGSTTYGRPYNDRTSFAGWLRELLPEADGRYNWEVINAGGISYASYRVARLMEELTQYEPDLFIVYSGHNEFLEERTYGTLRDLPAPVKTAAALLSNTRTWTAMSSALNTLGLLPDMTGDRRTELAGEVNTILARSAGPERYRRNDPLRKQILRHYRISLERMADIARSAGADIMFVTPASNLKDSSPFKSQHTDGLGAEAASVSEEMLSEALELMRQSSRRKALDVVDKALALDPGYAELHYRRGKVLFAMGRYSEAGEAFRRARDEDVCPLRALTPMSDILAGVTESENVTLVDFIGLIGRLMHSEHGHTIPGREYFLDHVHPTIAANRSLALELINTMEDKGIVLPSEGWGEEAIARVTAQVNSGIDRKEHARALVNLARVLNWAGKDEDAGALARRALKFREASPEAYFTASSILAGQYRRQGNVKKALAYFREALHAAPAEPQIHLQTGLAYLNEPMRNFKVAASHILYAAVFWPESDMAHMTFGLAMAERGRYSLAYSSLREAVRVNPRNREAVRKLERLKKILDTRSVPDRPPKVTLEKYPSGAPKKLVQVVPAPSGSYIPHGIWTEWHDNGELKRFIDYENGSPMGKETVWDRKGAVVPAPLNP